MSNLISGSVRKSSANARHRFEKLVMSFNDTLQRFNAMYEEGTMDGENLSAIHVVG